MDQTEERERVYLLHRLAMMKSHYPSLVVGVDYDYTFDTERLKSVYIQSLKQINSEMEEKKEKDNEMVKGLIKSIVEYCYLLDLDLYLKGQDNNSRIAEVKSQLHQGKTWQGRQWLIETDKVSKSILSHRPDLEEIVTRRELYRLNDLEFQDWNPGWIDNVVIEMLSKVVLGVAFNKR